MNDDEIERMLRFNCPNGCDGQGSYPDMSADGEWEQGQCQWCFEYGIPARGAIESYVTTRVKEAERLARIEELEKVMSGYTWLEWARLKDLRLKDGTKAPLSYIENQIKQLQALTTTTNGKEE